MAVLCETERYGYEIARIIEERRISLWTEFALSSVYAVLGRLERKGYVTRREIQQSGKPPRKLYSLSFSGRSALEDSLEKLSSPGNRIWGMFEIILLAWPILSGSRRQDLINNYRSSLKRRIENLRVPLASEINPISAAHISRPLAAARGELEWLEKFAFDSGIGLID